MSAHHSGDISLAEPSKEQLHDEKAFSETARETEAGVGADARQARAQPAGVSRIEAFSRAVDTHRGTMYVLYGAIAGIMVAACLDGSTVPSYEAIAAGSYGEHGQLLATIAIVTSVMGAASYYFLLASLRRGQTRSPSRSSRKYATSLRARRR